MQEGFNLGPFEHDRGWIHMLVATGVAGAALFILGTLANFLF